MISDSCYKLMVLRNLKGIGSTTLNMLSSNPSFSSTSIHELAKIDLRVKRAIEDSSALDISRRKVDQEIILAGEHGIKVLCLRDKEYPTLLKDIVDKPPVIYTKGEWPIDQEKVVAVIGTRKPTPHGEIIADRITRYFAQNGWSILSGLALGCDAIAHRTALSNESHTIAVLAHGFKTIAPSQNKILARQILDAGGLLVTEYDFNTDPAPYQFVARDRIQAGLARGVIMIQSSLMGGSLHASRAALEYDRVLAIPRVTAKDMVSHSDRVEANKVLTSNDDQARLKVLKCNAEKLKRIFVLSDSNDYHDLSIRLTTSQPIKNAENTRKQLSFLFGSTTRGS